MFSSVWGAFQEAAPVKAPPPPPRQQQRLGAAAILSASSTAPSSSIPLVRLFRCCGQHLQRHARTYTALATLVVVVGVGARLADCTSATAEWRRRVFGGGGPASAKWWRSGPAKGKGDDDDDGVVFIDPALSRFTAALNAAKRNKEAPLLRVLQDLQDLVEERHSSSPERGDPALYDDLCKAIEAKACLADELLTQYMVSLDGLPVNGRPELKARRKAVVQEASTLGERFAVYMPSRGTASGTAHSGHQERGEEGATTGASGKAVDTDESDEWERVSGDHTVHTATAAATTTTTAPSMESSNTEEGGPGSER